MAMFGFCFSSDRERMVMRMTKKFCILLALLSVFVSVLHAPQAQTQETKWKKTVTLPNGEVILDIGAEWDVVGENYGEWTQFGSHRDVFKITQEGNSFVAIRTKGNPYMPAGTAGARGELDMNGFKRVSIITAMGPMDAKSQISEHGNKIVIDDGRVVRQTLTRK
jgi:hypothetical protein